MTHLRIVRNELALIGFQAQIRNNQIIVSLKNRPVSTMEVKTELENIFGEIQFCISKLNNNEVFVSLLIS